MKKEVISLDQSFMPSEVQPDARKADILIITALFEELNAVQDYFTTLLEDTTDNTNEDNIDSECSTGFIIEKFSEAGPQRIRDRWLSIDRYRITDLNDRQLEVAVTHLPMMGNSASALKSFHLIQQLTPNLVILTGIAGTLKPKQLKLGDVGIASFTEWKTPNKVSEYKDLDHKDKNNKPFIGPQVEVRTLRPPVAKSVSAPYRAALNKLTRATGQLPFTDTNKPKEQEIKVGRLFSSEFVLNFKYWRELYAKDYDFIEMEAGGVLHAIEESDSAFRANGINRSPPEFICIKGISDECHKKKDDHWREVASKNAAHATLLFLNEAFELILGE